MKEDYDYDQVIFKKYNIQIPRQNLAKLRSKSRFFKDDDGGWMWSQQTCRLHPKALFVFGDNDIEKGKHGQAIIRDERNAAGIPTKHLPSSSPTESFYSDDEFITNTRRIKNAVFNIILQSKAYDTIFFPQKGLGTGLAQLDVRAPKIFQYLIDIQHDVFGITYS